MVELKPTPPSPLHLSKGCFALGLALGEGPRFDRLSVNGVAA